MSNHFVLVLTVLEFDVYDAIRPEVRAKDETGKDMTCSWGTVVRHVLLDPRVSEKLDVFELNDLRHKLTRVKPSDVVVISDKELDAMRPALARSTLHPSILFSGGIEVIRAIHDAPTKDPRVTETNRAKSKHASA